VGTAGCGCRGAAPRIVPVRIYDVGAPHHVRYDCKLFEGMGMSPRRGACAQMKAADRQ